MEAFPPIQAESTGPDTASARSVTKVEHQIEGSTGFSDTGSTADEHNVNAPPPPTEPTYRLKEPWRPSDFFEKGLSIFLIGFSVVIVFFMVSGLDVLFNTNTATGGDMGAHVWTGDFVWRKLLTQGRVTGWSDDWFAGFPVLGFYFPLPFWIMTILNVILPYNIAFKIVTALGLLLYPVTGWSLGHHANLRKPIPVFMGLAMLPYMVDRQWAIYGGNVGSTMAGEFSFTLSVAGALLFLGLLSKVMRTGTRRASAGIVLAMVGLSHLLPTIWVGVAGTAIILTHLDKRRTNLRNAYAVFVASGVVAAALWFAGFHRVGVVAAAAIALGAVVYDQFTKKLNLGQFGDAFAAVATGASLAMFWIWPFWNHLDYSNDMGYEKETKYLQNLFPWVRDKPEAGSAVFFFAFLLGLIGAAYALWTFGQAIMRARKANPNSWHTAGIGVCLLGAAAGTAAVLPWIRVSVAPEASMFNVANAVLLGTFLLFAAVLAVLVFAWEVDNDWNRLGVALTIVTALCAIVFRAIPYGFRLWNNRVLPFWLLGTFMLAAMGLHAIGHMLLAGARQLTGGTRGFPAANVYGLLAAALVTHMAIALPLGAVPGWFPAPKFTKKSITETPTSGGAAVTRNTGGWLLGYQRVDDSSDFNASLAKGWPPYNYKGYENRGANWTDYNNIIQTMKKVGVDHGCGRAQWEYESKQDRWGTPMALMLLPYWTDSCIGSMEGLYFESSATAPYHWLNSALVSKGPSNPQRELPYKALDVNEGVKKMQQWGVRYYMSFSPSAIEQADKNPDLELLTTTKYSRVCDDAETKSNTCPTIWKIYRVKNAEIVEGLKFRPAVVQGINQNQTGGWLDLAVAQYNNSETYPVPFAADGPKDWQRVSASTNRSRNEPTFGKTLSVAVPEQVPLPEVKVTNIVSSFDGKKTSGKPGTVKFRVDKIGVPVVVKMSYFPNFRVEGAKGPYRLAPNMMVVIPTQNNVTVSYKWDKNDYLGFLAGIFGIALAVVLYRQDRQKRKAVTVDGLSDWRAQRAAERAARAAGTTEAVVTGSAVTGSAATTTALATTSVDPLEATPPSSEPNPAKTEQSD